MTIDVTQKKAISVVDFYYHKCSQTFQRIENVLNYVLSVLI